MFGAYFCEEETSLHPTYLNKNAMCQDNYLKLRCICRILLHIGAGISLTQKNLITERGQQMIQQKRILQNNWDKR